MERKAVPKQPAQRRRGRPRKLPQWLSGVSLVGGDSLIDVLDRLRHDRDAAVSSQREELYRQLEQHADGAVRDPRAWHESRPKSYTNLVYPWQEVLFRLLDLAPGFFPHIERHRWVAERLHQLFQEQGYYAIEAILTHASKKRDAPPNRVRRLQESDLPRWVIEIGASLQLSGAETANLLNEARYYPSVLTGAHQPFFVALATHGQREATTRGAQAVVELFDAVPALVHHISALPWATDRLFEMFVARSYEPFLVMARRTRKESSDLDLRRDALVHSQMFEVQDTTPDGMDGGLRLGQLVPTGVSQMDAIKAVATVEGVNPETVRQSLHRAHRQRRQ